MPESDFTIESVLQATQSDSVTADATIYPRRFMADAWILGERWKHHRVRDHFGIESDLYVALSSNVGPYIAFTPIHWVLEDMITRIQALENSNRIRSNFTADAWLALSGTYGRGVFRIDAVIFEAGVASSFSIDARITSGGSFTMDAWVLSAFTMNAYIA